MKRQFKTNYVLAVVAFCVSWTGMLCFAIAEGFRIGYNHYKD